MTTQVHPKTCAEDASSYVRHNGWTRPVHGFQIVGWLLYIIFGLVNFVLLIPNFANPCVWISLLIVNLIVYVIHFIVHIIAATIDPIDDNVADKHKNALRPRKFDRSHHKHVIENQFCYICESQVGAKSKHCSLCNKCVSDFDHHCKWLNNCVGGKNYKWFALSMFSALVQSAIIMITALIHVIKVHLSLSVPGQTGQASKLIILRYEVDNQGLVRVIYLAILHVTLVISLVAFLLLTHLCGFHLFLNFVGLSTYEFVVRQRAANEQQNAKNAVNNNNIPSKSFITYLTNLKQRLTIGRYFTRNKVQNDEHYNTITNGTHQLSAKGNNNNNNNNNDNKLIGTISLSIDAANRTNSGANR